MEAKEGMKKKKGDRIELIGMERIDRPVKMARDTIDPEKIRELAESIREMGLLQPIIVRPMNGRFEVVAGDRRFLAHKLLELKTVKAIIKEMSDEEMVVIRGVENLQRENLSASEEARVYLSLKNEGGLGVMAIAKKCGKTYNTVSRYLNFAGCSEDVRRAVDQKKISLNTLETLQEIDDVEAFKYHFEMAAQNGVTTQVARLWVDDYLKTKAGKFYSDGGSMPPGGVESVAKPVFMTCEVCLGPAEMKEVRSMVVCVPCLKKVRHV